LGIVLQFTLEAKMKKLAILITLTLLLVACAKTAQQHPQQLQVEPRYVEHTIRYPGETLGKIAGWYTHNESNWHQIHQANSHIQPTRMRIGDRILIPADLVLRDEPPTAETFVVATKSTEYAVGAPIETDQTVTTTTLSSSTVYSSSTTDLTKDSIENESTRASLTISDQSATVMGDLNSRLFRAVLGGDAPQVRAAIQDGADVNWRENDRPMIGWAAQDGSVEMISILLESGADINNPDGFGDTPLMRAVDMNQPDAVALLITKGADIDARTPSNENVATIAIRNGNQEIFKILAENGADLSSSGEPLALTAAQYQYYDLIPVIAANGGDLDEASSYYTALSYAVDQGNSELVKLLLDSGADPNARAEQGLTPIVRAVENREILDMLIQAKADPNQTDIYGRTALILAIEKELPVDTITSLIDAGSEINHRDQFGNTPLIAARSVNLDEVVALLTEKGATE